MLAALLAGLLAGCGEPAGPLAGQPAGPYRLQLELSPSPPAPQEATEFAFTLTRTDSGKPVQDLQIVHERALHTFIVARDFSSFAHLHQEDLAPRSVADVAHGSFRFSYRLPSPGHYRVYSEFTHRDRAWLKRFEFATSGAEAATSAPAPSGAILDAVAGEFSAHLAPSPAVLRAGQEAELVLELERGGLPVTNLALWLGSEVHAALWRQDGEHFAHTHSDTPEMAAMRREMAAHPGRHSAASMIAMMSRPARLNYPGPRVPLRHTFPAPGLYRLFVQCAPGGALQVFPFVLEVQASPAGADTRAGRGVPRT